MRSPYKFIVTPLEGKYRTTKQVAGKTLYLTSSIEDAKYVSRLAVVFSVPLFYYGNIKDGDIVVIHHNIFRDYYNQAGKVTISYNTLQYEDKIVFIVEEELIYLYKSEDNKWRANNDFCFIEPIRKIDNLSNTSVLDERMGIVVYSNELDEGTLIGFTPESEYEFDIDGKTLYRMKNSDICLIECED